VVASGNPIYLLVLNGFRGLYSRIGSLYFANPKGREISRDYYQKLIELAEKNKFDDSIYAVRRYGVESGKLWLELKDDITKELSDD
jgi:GntR family negative regulator for fad regulon and positive regulator of fabA